MNSFVPGYLQSQGQTLNYPCALQSDCAAGYCCSAVPGSYQKTCQMPNSDGIIRHQWTIRKMDIVLPGYTQSNPSYGIEQSNSGIVEPGWKVHIVANEGDVIEVLVKNGLDQEGTSLHWHGMMQNGTNWSDGATGATQRPIAPGATFLYRFQAQPCGTHWWHGHYNGQYLYGLSGALTVHCRNEAYKNRYLGNEVTLQLQDWYVNPYQDLVSWYKNVSP